VRATAGASRGRFWYTAMLRARSVRACMTAIHIVRSSLWRRG